MGNGGSAPEVDGNTLTIGGKVVNTFNDREYGKLRKYFGVDHDFVPATGNEAGGMLNSQFSFEDMGSGGGKGGDPMAFTQDSHMKYLVKECSPGDHDMLFILTAQYVEHLVEGREMPDPNVGCRSLIARFFAHFQDPATGKNYVVMNNWLPPIPEDAYHQIWGGYEVPDRDDALQAMKTTASSFDLKGTADDKTLRRNGNKITEVHKRIWNVQMWCGTCAWNSDRKTYYNGKRHATAVKFNVTREQKKWIWDRLSRDIEFLIDNNLMDYSLLVRQCTLPNSKTNMALQAANMHDLGTQPLVMTLKNEDRVQLLHLGLIDFLQDWTCGKKCANCIKRCERNKSTVPPDVYGKRCLRYFQQKFQETAAEAIKLDERQTNRWKKLEEQMPDMGDGLGPAGQRPISTQELVSTLNSRQSTDVDI